MHHEMKNVKLFGQRKQGQFLRVILKDRSQMVRWFFSFFCIKSHCNGITFLWKILFGLKLRALCLLGVWLATCVWEFFPIFYPHKQESLHILCMVYSDMLISWFNMLSDGDLTLFLIICERFARREFTCKTRLCDTLWWLLIFYYWKKRKIYVKFVYFLLKFLNAFARQFTEMAPSYLICHSQFKYIYNNHH